MHKTEKKQQKNTQQFIEKEKDSKQFRHGWSIFVMVMAYLPIGF